MNLHADVKAFLALLKDIHLQTGMRSDIAEKDYYVTLLLSELSTKQPCLPAYFKGGTALYKALGQMKRFSEDIDLTVESANCSKSQAHKRLKSATQSYTVLPRVSGGQMEEVNSGSITSVYVYEPIVAIPNADSLERFGKVKVEATSFTNSIPHEALQIAPFVYSLATQEQRNLLESNYNVRPFTIETITMERIFVDKILAAEFYYEQQQLADVAKHLYDLTVMIQQDKIKKLLNDRNQFAVMLGYKREEETRRFGSTLATKPLAEFTLYKIIDKDADLKLAFSRMQEVYVFDESYRITFDEVSQRMTRLFTRLPSLDPLTVA